MTTDTRLEANKLVVLNEGREVEKLMRVIGQFITSCSSSMRGPLKSIEGLVSLLQNRNIYSDDELRMFLSHINDSTRKMENMLDGLEQFLENSRKNLAPQEVDLTELIQKIFHEFSAELHEHAITPRVKVEQQVKLYTDAARLRIALCNVIENAIRFSDPGKERKYIEVQGNVNFTNCSINVVDNGIGIESGEESKVFDLFFRGTERSKGLGVGLYVVREVLERMGGSITVYSRRNIGSKFFLWIPNQLKPGHIKIENKV